MSHEHALPEPRTLLDAMKVTVSHFESLEADLAHERFRNMQQQIVIKIIARRNEGKLLWSAEELSAAKADDRCVMLGALELELYGEPND